MRQVGKKRIVKKTSANSNDDKSNTNTTTPFTFTHSHRLTGELKDLLPSSLSLSGS